MSGPDKRIMDKLRFALIGTGGIAQTYAQAFQTSEVCELVAVADVNRKAADAFAEPLGARSFGDHRELAESEGFDAVIVSTPPASHREIAVGFMERGRHVLCEKPLCLTQAAAREMIDTARGNGVRFTMASKFRYVRDVVKAKSLVASGVLGDIVQFENAFTARVDMSGRWNSEKETSGGGVLIDNGTHSVDIIRYFLGPVTDVLAVDAGSTQGLGVDENVRMFARTADGVVASVDLTWGINKELPHYISVYGTRGTLHVGWRESKYRLHSNPDWTVFGSGYDKVAAFRAKIENFAGAVRGEEELLIRPDDALASVEVIEAAYRSLEEDLWQEVAERTGKAAK